MPSGWASSRVPSFYEWVHQPTNHCAWAVCVDTICCIRSIVSSTVPPVSRYKIDSAKPSRIKLRHSIKCAIPSCIAATSAWVDAAAASWYCIQRVTQCTATSTMHNASEEWHNAHAHCAKLSCLSTLFIFPLSPYCSVQVIKNNLWQSQAHLAQTQNETRRQDTENALKHKDILIHSRKEKDTQRPRRAICCTPQHKNCSLLHAQNEPRNVQWHKHTHTL